MKKFVNFYLLLLVVFIIVGISGFSFSKNENPEQAVEELALENTPGYATMRTIEEMTKEQQLEDAILDIQVTPKLDAETVVMEMQSSEFMSQDTLLKDSYNMLVKIADEPQITEFTFIWHQPVKNKNQVVLSMSFDRVALNQLPTITYSDLASIAKTFEQY
ncbi:hypothetical protein [Metasolibacillus sp.]|uniref:hypothetical protein n=1 Tax=Metasolibacillus sp. TaxID=2703680 RepID=UPI0025D22799|nr:hypothetical protein [Metasolibacillus sp.]MCT6925866.1 hypothetical protein [Metasolibacillus sp.]MCT6942100.1 hypothetical protein [Metasolibacillus sp.]